MLSSNRHVMLRLAVFEIFVVERPKCRPKMSDFERSGAPPTKGKKTYPRPICTIMQFTSIGATVAEISVTGQRKQHGKLSTLSY